MSNTGVAPSRGARRLALRNPSACFTPAVLLLYVRQRTQHAGGGRLHAPWIERILLSRWTIGDFRLKLSRVFTARRFNEAAAIKVDLRSEFEIGMESMTERSAQWKASSTAATAPIDSIGCDPPNSHP
jgi:hypothetical protein